ncbi:MAG: aminotransferase class V-fold PLP-dependent enzyme [Sphingomonadaceae bacterium]
MDYGNRIASDNIARYEHDLLVYGMQQLSNIKGVRMIGTARDKASVMSFVLDGYSTEEVGKALDEEAIAVRTGHHCAQPILRRFGVETTVRPSLAFYNTYEEIDRLIAVVSKLAH